MKCIVHHVLSSLSYIQFQYILKCVEDFAFVYLCMHVRMQYV